MRRYLATIACAHRAAKIPNRNNDEDVKLASKGLCNRHPKRQRQAKAVGWHEIKQFLITAGDGIRADRERALLCVADDTMARGRGRRDGGLGRFVYAGREWPGDYSAVEDGPGAEGTLAYLSLETVRYLRVWLQFPE